MALTITQRKAIDVTASRLFKSAGISGAPVDLQQVADSIGLRIELFPFPDEISGLLKKERRVIGINENHNKRRQRFTLAHEIGHYILGHGITSDSDFVDDANTDTSSTIEKEANYFASTLLMPSDLVKQSIRKDFDIKILADTFQVSEQAMTIRILELGLLK